MGLSITLSVHMSVDGYDLGRLSAQAKYISCELFYSQSWLVYGIIKTVISGETWQRLNLSLEDLIAVVRFCEILQKNPTKISKTHLGAETQYDWGVVNNLIETLDAIIEDGYNGHIQFLVKACW